MIRYGLWAFLMFPQIVLAASLVDHPAQCFAQKNYPCALRSQEGSLRFERGGNTYLLGGRSSLKFLTEDRVQLLEGALWMEKSKELHVIGHPEFGFRADGEFFLQKTTTGPLFVYNLEAKIQFESKGVFKTEALPIGFQNWYGRLNIQKQVDRGVIRVIDTKDFLQSWIPVSGLSVAEMKGRIRTWRERWADNVNVAARFYQEVISRRIASQDELDQRRASRQKLAEEERRRLRQMYRQKTGFSEDFQ